MRARAGYPPDAPPAVNSPPMHRLTDPVYRRRALEFAADAVLAARGLRARVQAAVPRRRRAASPSATRRCCSARSPSSRSARRWCSSSSACTSSGGATSGSPTSGRWSARSRVASALMVARLRARQALPTTACRARSIDLRLHPLPASLLGRRPARPPLDRRAPERAAPRRGRAREVLVVGAGSGGQMVVRELKLNPNLGARAIGFLDDDPRKRGHAHRGAQGARDDRRDRRRSSTA